MSLGPILRRLTWLVGAVVLGLVCMRTAWAGNPDLKWRTLETEHFFVHYAAGNEDIADRTAANAERAYSSLAEAWGHRIFLKTHILLTDGTDVANGSATALPFPRITANVSAPEAMSPLDTYDDWINILITHELTHVFHLDTVHGVYRAINAIFGLGVLGKITMPNVLQPRWVVEGVATYYESELTSAGRLQSAQFDMFLRMAVLEDALQTIDQASSGARWWPHGSTAYLYGLHLFRYIASRYGRDKLRELSHLYARQTVPYGINRAIRDVVGVDFETLWKEFQADTRRRFEAQARRIRARGVRQGRRLTFSGESKRYPFWSHDDRELLYFESDGHRVSGIRKVPSTGSRVREGWGIGRQGADLDTRTVLTVYDVSEGSYVGASNDIVFDMLATHEFRYQWSDLYRWSGGDRARAERLTFGMRASEPQVSPDGRTVVFRRNDAGQSRLGFLDIASGEVTEVAGAERIAQVYTPRWSPDGRQVAFSGWREGGYRDIYLYDRELGTTRRITATRHLDTSPSWSPDGRWILYSSDLDDVFNVYAHEVASGRTYQVTNVFGGAFEATVSHDGKRLAYVGYSARGFDLWSMEFDPSTWAPVAPTDSDVAPAPDPQPGGRERRQSASSSRYRPGRTFFPRTIVPAALEFQSSQFATDVALTTQVQDVLGFHSLTGSFDYIIPFNVPVGSVAYSFNRWFPRIDVGFGRGFRILDDFRRYSYDHEGIGPDGRPTEDYVSTGYRERSTRFEGGISVPVLRHPRHRLGAAAQYRFTRYKNLDASDDLVDPNAPISRLPQVGDVAEVDLNITYENDLAVRFGYGDRLGTRVAVGVAVLDRALGGDYGDFQVSSTITEFIPMPWRGHQVLAVRLYGGASAGGLSRRGAFAVGGLGEQNDVIRRLLTRTPFGTAGALRGYFPGQYRGLHATVLNVEYRIPLLDVDRGIGTLPFFMRRIAMVPFVDGGYAWRGPFQFGDLRWSAGASLIFGFRLGYVEAVDLVLEYHHGFDEEDGLDTVRIGAARAF